MRHRKDGNRLGRTSAHRKAMLENLVTALFEHERVRTTDAKAKEARRVAERLITRARDGSLASRRVVLRSLRDKKVVRKLFEEIAPRYEGRNGGYTRIIKLGRRRGDGASVSILELVGYELSEKTKGGKGKSK
ncbi:50S ribosomal protein L17 [candidate division TA06 bacterium DG_24]|uniref:Large ribosomal subunit protein bL17 n=3 Tax=Bacteria division TA06 TaxID=1156500 RepID=A0A0S8JKH5_UNCT6|nr:MAG: 50S ribosomal protein L17 [candidate division TA06 bacterium DG_24]KPK70886.1 MAG: 50S ribosomal protein L17 [candidate division TA06 bacterium SM23_40]KPL10263.1 MAG: 50S ribosomal protein L17 [candidate division TA06 bacterium SM1_40]